MQEMRVRVIRAVARFLSTVAILGVVDLVNPAAQNAGEVAEDTLQCDLDPPTDVEELESCLERSPQDVELSLDLAAAYESDGRPGDALRVYQRAVEVDPRDADARVRLGAALRRAGDHEGASREGAVAVGFRPNDPAALTLAAGDAHPSNVR
jgi:Flp pilus assembly protein TadD